MKKIITVILLVICTNIFGQEIKYFDKDWKETDKESAHYYRKIEPLNSNFIVEDYFINGQIQFRGISSSDKEPFYLEGETMWYNENGIITQKANYKNGNLNGIYTEYFSTGEVSNQAIFFENKINGTHTKYRKPNQLEFKVDYKNGIVDGIYEFYNSNGTLFNKGMTKNGIQNGKCFDYYFEGELRKEYTIKEGFLDGELIEYDRKGVIMTKGVFDMGKVILFESKSLRLVNNSKFSSSMNLINGIEEWKIFRDEKLILESFYKNGYKIGNWKVFNYDGSELYQTISFTDDFDCKDTYLQGTSKEFDPFLFLSNRFNFESEMIEVDDCNNAVITKHSTNDNEHPFYYLKEKR